MISFCNLLFNAIQRAFVTLGSHYSNRVNTHLESAVICESASHALNTPEQMRSLVTLPGSDTPRRPSFRKSLRWEWRGSWKLGGKSDTRHEERILWNVALDKKSHEKIQFRKMKCELRWRRIGRIK